MLGPTIGNGHTCFTPENAEKIAAEMNEDEEDWIYVVVHDPKGIGFSYISVIEDGEEIARM